jgi:hypothetical protein
MKIGNLHGTFDSCEMGGECLEDKGTAKKPLPFLRSVKLIIRHGAFKTIPFCCRVQYLCTKSEGPQDNTLQIQYVLHPNLVDLLGHRETPEERRCQWIRQHYATSRQGVERSEIYFSIVIEPYQSHTF